MSTVAETRARGCQFCGETRGLTREHVLAEWVRPLVDATPAPYVLQTGEKIERVWDAPIASLTVRRVCRGCNNGWMHDLEIAAKPVLTALISGRVRSLTAEEQGVLAAWGAKTAMAYDLTKPSPTVPAENRSWVRENGSPPPATVMLLARYGGKRFPLYAAHGTRKFDIQVEEQPKQKWLAYLVSVSVGPLVMQLFGHGMANVVDFRPRGWKADFARVIWPDPQPLTWPLPRALGDDGLRRFVRDV